MEYYKEYSIRCMTCNEPIACFSTMYEEMLASGVSGEEALDNLGIEEPCSRIAMMNPTIVTFNMENREIIEGLKDLQLGDQPDPYLINDFNPVFNACLENYQQNIIIKPTGAPITSLFSSNQRNPVAPIIQSNDTSTSAIIPGVEFGVDLTDIEAILGPGLEVPIKENTKFEEPTMVGIPTINQDKTQQKINIKVGAGKQTLVLNGRTYLAR